MGLFWSRCTANEKLAALLRTYHALGALILSQLMPNQSLGQILSLLLLFLFPFDEGGN
jgi:hypothetical protein